MGFICLVGFLYFQKARAIHIIAKETNSYDMMPDYMDSNKSSLLSDLPGDSGLMSGESDEVRLTSGYS